MPQPTMMSAEQRPIEAFAIRNLSILAYAQGFTLWHVNTHNGSVFVPKDWMQSAGDMMQKGDVIHITNHHGQAAQYVVQPDTNYIYLIKH